VIKKNITTKAPASRIAELLSLISSIVFDISIRISRT